MRIPDWPQNPCNPSAPYKSSLYAAASTPTHKGERLTNDVLPVDRPMSSTESMANPATASSGIRNAYRAGNRRGVRKSKPTRAQQVANPQHGFRCVKLKNKFRHLNAKRRVNPFPPQPARQDFTAAFQEQYLAGVLGGRIGLAHDLIHYSSGRSIISELRKGA